MRVHFQVPVKNMIASIFDSMEEGLEDASKEIIQSIRSHLGVGAGSGNAPPIVLAKFIELDVLPRCGDEVYVHPGMDPLGVDSVVWILQPGEEHVDILLEACDAGQVGGEKDAVEMLTSEGWSPAETEILA